MTYNAIDTVTINFGGPLVFVLSDGTTITIDEEEHKQVCSNIMFDINEAERQKQKIDLELESKIEQLEYALYDYITEGIHS